MLCFGMPKKFDLIGTTIGRLTVVERIGSKRHNGRSNIVWRCLCTCGFETFLTTNTIRNGSTRSCGCLMRETSSRIGRLHPPPPTSLDLTGQTFGLLTAISPTKKRRRHCVVWQCLCACGNHREVATTDLSTGDVRSCGCLRGKAFITHGLTCQGKRTKEYIVWAGMLQRCNNPKNAAFDRYGGRGIAVYDRWHSFEKFLADMGPRPEGASIDRIDNDGDYEPNNCRWATEREQQRNRSNNRMLTWRGTTMCAADWSDQTGIPARRIISRLSRGWSIDRTLSTRIKRQSIL